MHPNNHLIIVVNVIIPSVDQVISVEVTWGVFLSAESLNAIFTM